MNPFIQKHAEEFRASVEHFKKDLSHVRTGQANPELVDGVMINAYGTMTALNQLASITVPEPKMMVVQPWDKSLLKDIEKGLTMAKLGFSPVNDGNVIRLPMPPMSEENRKDLVKVIKEKSEKARVGIRQIREKVKESIQSAEKGKEISEDDKFKYLKDLDKHTNEQIDLINEAVEKKSTQIMTI
ncbi:MAG: ribosome recycling factor [Parcubacteria group bacterium]|nr:ribosome recycling factor [Parcubacteria group bacterium]